MPGTGKQDARYEMSIGGITLLQDEKVIDVAAPAAHYLDLKYKHVQSLWEAMKDPEIAATAMAFMGAVAEQMTALGHAYGVEDGRMTEEDLSLIKVIKGRTEKVKKEHKAVDG